MFRQTDFLKIFLLFLSFQLIFNLRRQQTESVILKVPTEFSVKLRTQLLTSYENDFPKGRRFT